MKNNLKKLSLVILTLFALSASAQVNMTMGVGTDFKYPVYSLKVGYETGRVNFSGGYQIPIKRATEAVVLAGAEVGYNFISESNNSIILSFGFYRVSPNNDQKTFISLWRPSASLRYVRMVSENGGLYANAMYVGNNFSVTGGIIFKFD